jgi:phosphoribosylanthranilate isomerase
MTVCKICDVRDYDTALMCAQFGANLLGLHCIFGIKASRRQGLMEISDRLRVDFPEVGIVLVTLVTAGETICSIIGTLRPTHLQLHASTWTGAEIFRLRDRISRDNLPMPKIIGVLLPSEGHSRVEDIARAADLLLFDRSFYGDKSAARIEPAGYQDSLRWASELDRFCLVAGGLTPGNVGEYIDLLDPWGVDVQGGVEVEGHRGPKDPTRVQAFIQRVRRGEG